MSRRLYRWRDQAGIGDLLLQGWLPPGPAAIAWGITRAELDRRIRSGDLRVRRVVPHVMLVEGP